MLRWLHYSDMAVDIHEFVDVALSEQLFFEHSLCERRQLDSDSISKNY